MSTATDAAALMNAATNAAVKPFEMVDQWNRTAMYESKQQLQEEKWQQTQQLAPYKAQTARMDSEREMLDTRLDYAKEDRQRRKDYNQSIMDLLSHIQGTEKDTGYGPPDIQGMDGGREARLASDLGMAMQGARLLYATGTEDYVRESLRSPEGQMAVQQDMGTLPIDKDHKAMGSHYLQEAVTNKERMKLAQKAGAKQPKPQNTTDQSELAVDQFLGQVFNTNDVDPIKKEIMEMPARKAVNPDKVDQYTRKLLPYDADNVNSVMADIASKMKGGSGNWSEASDQYKQKVAEKMWAVHMGAKQADVLRRAATWESFEAGMAMRNSHQLQPAKNAAAQVFTALNPVLDRNLKKGMAGQEPVQSAFYGIKELFKQAYSERPENAPQPTDGQIQRMLDSTPGRRVLAADMIQAGLMRSNADPATRDYFKKSRNAWLHKRIDEKNPLHKAMTLTLETLRKAYPKMDANSSTGSNELKKAFFDKPIDEDGNPYFMSEMDVKGGLKPLKVYAKEEGAVKGSNVANPTYTTGMENLLGTAGVYVNQAQASTIIRGQRSIEQEGGITPQFGGGIGSLPDSRKQELILFSQTLPKAYNLFVKHMSNYKTNGKLNLAMTEFYDPGNPYNASRGFEGFEFDQGAKDKYGVNAYRPVFDGVNDPVFGLTDENGENMLVKIEKHYRAVKGSKYSPEVARVREKEGKAAAKEVLQTVKAERLTDLYKVAEEARGFGIAHLTTYATIALRNVGETGRKFIQKYMGAEQTYQKLRASRDPQSPAAKRLAAIVDDYGDSARNDLERYLYNHMWALSNSKYDGSMDRLIPPKAEMLEGELVQGGTEAVKNAILNEFSLNDSFSSIGRPQAHKGLNAIFGMFGDLGERGSTYGSALGNQMLATVSDKASENRSFLDDVVDMPNADARDNWLLGGILSEEHGEPFPKDFTFWDRFKPTNLPETLAATRYNIQNLAKHGIQHYQNLPKRAAQAARGIGAGISAAWTAIEPFALEQDDPFNEEKSFEERTIDIPYSDKRAMGQVTLSIPGTRKAWESVSKYIGRHSKMGETEADDSLQAFKTMAIHSVLTEEQRSEFKSTMAQALHKVPGVQSPLTGDDAVLVPEYDEQNEQIYLRLYFVAHGHPKSSEATGDINKQLEQLDQLSGFNQ